MGESGSGFAPAMLKLDIWVIFAPERTHFSSIRLRETNDRLSIRLIARHNNATSVAKVLKCYRRWLYNEMARKVLAEGPFAMQPKVRQ